MAPSELQNVLADEGEFNTLGTFNDIIVSVWRGSGVPQQWKYATIIVLPKRYIGLSVAIIVVSPSRLTPAKYS